MFHRALPACLVACTLLSTGWAREQPADSGPAVRPEARPAIEVDDASGVSLTARVLASDTRHIDRIAKLERLRSLAASAGQTDRVNQIDELMERAELLRAERLTVLEDRAGADAVEQARKTARGIRTTAAKTKAARDDNPGRPAGTPDARKERDEDDDRDDNEVDDDAGNGPSRDRADRPERPERGERGIRGNRGNRPERGNRPDRANRGARDDEARRGPPEGRGNGKWQDRHPLVTICFAPPGNPEARRTKRVSRAALQTFLDMGATEGPCGGEASPDIRPETNMPRPAEDRDAGPGAPDRPTDPLIPQEIIDDVLRRLPEPIREIDPAAIFRRATESITGANADDMLARLAREIDSEWDRLETPRD